MSTVAIVGLISGQKNRREVREKNRLEIEILRNKLRRESGENSDQLLKKDDSEQKSI